MNTKHLVQRVFQVRYFGEIGSAIVVEVDGHSYVATAKHVVAGARTGEDLSVYVDGEWRPRGIADAAHSTGEADVSVLTLAEPLVAGLPPLPVTMDGLEYASEVYFLGFPLNRRGSSQVFGGHPVPYIRRAIVSNMSDAKDEFFLDGHNTKGFSGGPIVAEFGDGLHLVGIISAYIPDRKDISGSGTRKLVVELNSGIISAWNSDIIVELARSIAPTR